MTQIKEMPYSEKYAQVIDSMKFDEGFILPFSALPARSSS